jgi:hypothetical protein
MFFLTWVATEGPAVGYSGGNEEGLGKKDRAGND